MSKYDDLITAEHAKRPKFVAVIDLTVQPSLDQQAAVSAFPADYDLDTAVGAQLDTVGLWVGIGRTIKTPLTGVYFEWGVAGVGWGEGYWRGRFDPVEGITTLSDEFYRLLLRATIALNYWDGTILPSVQAIAPLFPANSIYIQDNQNMSMSIAVAGAPLDVISAALLTGGYLALKADTVRIDYFFPSVISGGKIFAWGAETDALGGWGDSSWGISAPFTG